MKLAIVVVEDEPEVRDAVLGDLAPFADTVRIEPAEDVDDALEVVDEIDGDGDVVALILADHRLPGRSGVDMLVEMAGDERTADARKVLVTGQAVADIRAIFFRKWTVRRAFSVSTKMQMPKRTRAANLPTGSSHWPTTSGLPLCGAILDT